MNTRKQLNRNRSITLDAALVAGLFFMATVTLAGATPTTSTGSSTFGMIQEQLGPDAEVAPRPLPSVEDVSRRPGLLDELRAIRRAQRECFERRLAHARESGNAFFPWSLDNLPPACRLIGGGGQ